MSGDAVGLKENKAFGFDSWRVQHAEIGVALVFATTSKAMMMKLKIFDIFKLHQQAS